jgi:hypothetical protein
MADLLRRHPWPLILAIVGLLIAAPAKADEALDALRAAAEQGDAAAQYKLGTRYLDEGDGAQRRRDTAQRDADNTEAIKWLRLAAEHGNVEAQARLGVLYTYGGIVSRDYAEAAKWTRMAAEQGDRNAMLRLSEMYAMGRGVPRDPVEERRWNQRHTATAPHKVDRLGLLLEAIGIAVLAFGAALGALHAGMLTGWKRSVATVFVHLVGPLLVLDSFLTYGTWLLTWNCGHDFLATHCTQIADPGTRHLLNSLGDFQMFNLVFRFMAIVGLVVDVLAVWYLVYLWRLLGRRSRQHG